MAGMSTVEPGEFELPLELEAISLKRLPFASSGICIHCSRNDEDAGPSEPRLVIEFTESYIALCPAHEGELLQVLLNNYLRRKARKAKQGFKGLLKHEAEAEGEDFED